MFVGLEIMRMQRRHLVECLAESMLNFFSNADALFEKVNVACLQIFRTIESFFLIWILLSKTWNQCLMNLQTDFFFDLSGNGFQNSICECLVDVALVVIDSNVGLVEMSYVPEHI
jgi:hypothetical protein